MQMELRKESGSRICKVLALTAIGTALLAIGAGAQGSKTQAIKKVEKPTKPKLVVLLVVDQMRGDYVDKFRGPWTGGLKRQLHEGWESRRPARAILRFRRGCFRRAMGWWRMPGGTASSRKW